jgi:hypothetical protein
MMESDPECPVCHSSAARATAAAPGPMNDNKPGLGLLLPMFGGAIGGAIYGAIKIAENANSTAGTQSSWGVAQAPVSASGVSSGSGAKALRWLFGAVFLLGGGLFLIASIANFLDTWKIAQRVPKEVTAAELIKTDVAKSVPGPWLAYTFTESKPIELTVKRQRLGKAGDVQGDCLLVRVEDKWLFASVAHGFEGNQLVGRLVPLESKLLLENIRKLEPNPSALLAYEFNGVDGSASDQQQRYIGAGVVALLSLLSLYFGWRLVRGKRQPAPTAASASHGSFLPQPAR